MKSNIKEYLKKELDKCYLFIDSLDVKDCLDENTEMYYRGKIIAYNNVLKQLKNE